MPEGASLTPGESVLVVDLDGTLIASDLLFESFWSAMARRPLAALGAAFRHIRDRAALKQALAALSEIDVTTLPYKAEVLAYLDNWRAAGGRVVLATASDHALAQKIADHLGLFDEVHGTAGGRNLKGPAKAAFLSERFGPGGFTYIGDAMADLPVWAAAARIVTVDAGPKLTAQVARLGPEAEHLRAHQASLATWLRAIRVHQWLKNLLVFVPILASHAFSAPTLVLSVLAFASFSLTASSIYLLNDLLDLPADRSHPRKRHRPLAAGTVPIGLATALIPILLATGFGLAIALGPAFVVVLTFYFLLTTAYSFYLKRRTIVDIWVLTVLYAMRIAAGAAATGIVPSVWLMAFSIFFFFSLAAVKRQAELVDLVRRDEQAVRRRGYHRDDVLLIAAMAIAAGYLSILVMALYVRTPFIEELYSFPQALLGICLVLLYWVSRIVMVTHRGLMHDDPLIYALRDPISRLCLATMMAFAIAASVLDVPFT